jgi:hypothetical protein
MEIHKGSLEHTSAGCVGGLAFLAPLFLGSFDYSMMFVVVVVVTSFCEDYIPFL